MKIIDGLLFIAAAGLIIQVLIGFSYLGDLFYGKKSKPNAPPKWADYRSGLS